MAYKIITKMKIAKNNYFIVVFSYLVAIFDDIIAIYRY